MQMARTPRSIVAAALAALCLVLAACGGSGETTAGSSAAPGGTSGPGGTTGTVTITHQYGSTEVVGVPERIVSLDPQFTDALLALGVKPTAYVAPTRLVAGGTFPWQQGLEGVTQIPSDGTTYDNQDVFNADPQLIVGSYSIENEERYEALKTVAPTIGAVDAKRQVQRWQDLVTLAGKIVRKEDAAAKVIAEAEADLAKRSAALPGLKGKTYTFVNYVPGDALYVVADPDDGAAEAFGALGLSINPKVLAAAEGTNGRAKFSLEQVSTLDSDMIIMLTNGGKPTDLIGFDALTATRKGAVVEVDMSAATGLNQPSSLSLPWVLDKLGSTLEKAAA